MYPGRISESQIVKLDSYSPMCSHPKPTSNTTISAAAGRIAIMPGTRGPVPVPLRDDKRDITQDMLNLLDEKSTIHTSEDFPQIPQPEIKAALDRLKSRSMIQYETADSEQVLLTGEAKTICDEGSHEYKVWDAVRQNGKLSIKELPVGFLRPVLISKLRRQFIVLTNTFLETCRCGFSKGGAGQCLPKQVDKEGWGCSSAVSKGGGRFHAESSAKSSRDEITGGFQSAGGSQETKASYVVQGHKLHGHQRPKICERDTSRGYGFDSRNTSEWGVGNCQLQTI